MKNRLVFLSSVLFLMTFVLTAQFGQSQSTAQATSVPTVEVASEMGLIPSNCGILAEPMAIHPLIQQAIGTWPLWIALPNWESGKKGALVMPNRRYPSDPPLEGWWSTKVAWFIPKSYTGEVRVRGFNVDDNSPMYFHFTDPEPTEIATLDPAHPGGFVPELNQWAFFPSGVYVSKAGCYQIETEWEGGRWQQIIAVGSIEE